MRLRALAVARWALWRGWSEERFCVELGIDCRTLRGWRGVVAQVPRSLGAPAGTSTPQQVRQVSDFLLLWGVDVGVPVLHDHFPAIARGELARLLWLARARQKAALNGGWRCSLEWTCVGSVWAIDYTESPAPIDGCYDYVLVLRDLASGYTIDAWPTVKADAETTVACLTRALVQHGAPLVLKADNHGHFVNAQVDGLLGEWGVTFLPSPPYTPSYNGSCEAGIGGIKTRVAHLAMRHGDPAHWTSNHVESGRLQGNRTDVDGRGAIPEQIWAGRTPIAAAERERFRASVAALEQRHIAEADAACREPFPDAIRRRATADALTGAGFLAIRSRPVHQPLLSEIPA